MNEQEVKTALFDIPDAEKLSGSGTKLSIGAFEVMDGSLGKMCVVFDLRLAERRAVGSNEHKLRCRAKQQKRKKSGMVVRTGDLLSKELQPRRTEKQIY